MKFKFNDGGRSAAGYRGQAGDCVTRAIAIATGKPYQEVYDALNALIKSKRQTKRIRGTSARTGTPKGIERDYLAALGWTWTPTMQIGQGCKIHLADGELPMGRLIVSVSRHLTAVIDGVVNDTYDPSRDETRCVYGYWRESFAVEPLTTSQGHSERCHNPLCSNLIEPINGTWRRTTKRFCSNECKMTAWIIHRAALLLDGLTDQAKLEALSR